MIPWLALASRFVLANWKAFVVSALLACVVWFYFHAVNTAYEKGYGVAQAEDAKAAQKQHDAIQGKIDNADAKHTQELEAARVQMDALRSDLRNTRLRLSVRVAPGTPTPNINSSVDHGEARAYIDPADAEAIVAITGQGDDAIRQLSAAQDVIRALTAPDAGRSAVSGSPPR